MYPGNVVGFPDRKDIVLVFPLPALPNTPILKLISGVPGERLGRSRSPAQVM